MTRVIDDYRVNGLWVKSIEISGLKYFTKAGQAWYGIKRRCLIGGAEQLKTPTYIGCSFSAEFSNFQLFAEWYTKQIGYSQSGFNLDKDLLEAGNKEYNSKVCVLIPAALNSFLVNCEASRGKYPVGVCYDSGHNKFKASINISGKPVNLGVYQTPEIAAIVYKKAKEAEAYRWYERLRDSEFIVDPRVIERMRTWTLENKR